MTDGTPTTRRSGPSGDIADPPTPAYGGWSDDRLVECYRRNSRLLREYGADERTIRVLCAVEEHLRARIVDPDAVIAARDV